MVRRAGGAKGPVENVVIDPGYFDVRLPARGRFVHDLPSGYTAIAYVFDGAASFDADGFDLQNDHSLILWEREDAEHGSDLPVSVIAGTDGTRLLLMTGKPLGEHVAWHGPIVMNTQDELRTAFRELDEGTFLRQRG